MKIQFIGTGNMDSERFNACILVNDCILIDAPPGVGKTLLKNRFDIRKIKAILITHQHIDHYFDLPILIRELSNCHIPEIHILANQSLIDNFETLMRLAFPDVYQEILQPIQIHFTILKEYGNYSLLNFHIHSIPVIHGNLDSCFGFILKNNETSIGYSGDASYTKEIEYICKNCNSIILDSTKLIGDRDHMGLNNIYDICKKYPQKAIFITHLSEQINTKKIKKHTNLIISNDNKHYKINKNKEK